LVRLTRCPLCPDSDQLPQRSKTTRCARRRPEQVQQKVTVMLAV
jgi:hypothetical protein